MKIIGILLLSLFTLTAFLSVQAPKKKLSEYGFFSEDIRLQRPGNGVLPYHLNTPLFSDEAEKLRFVYMPDGKTIPYNDSIVFDFPVGAALIKTFYFPVDARDPAKGRRLMETRVLMHEADGWKAYPYIWNDEQTDAFLDVAGDTKPIQYIDANGKKQARTYVIPNMNQCKGCHNKGEKLMPIGPSAWQLNGEHPYDEGSINQLKYWASKGLLNDLPQDVPKGVVAADPATGSLDERARMWLDINCAHCHRPDGPAASSGLYLGWREKEQTKIGIGKTPVAAGRGSGNLNVDIVPGKPEESIIYYRIHSTDPGVMMPELGRTIVDAKGAALIKEWIKKMPAN